MEGLERRVLLSSWYVSPLGSDANPGSKAKPFQTIQHAADVAQPGDTVFLRRGTYREAVVPLTSGSPGAPIVFRAYKRETVTIDGADPVGGWSVSPSGGMQAPVAWDLGEGRNQLFLDGRMLDEAQWPNTPGNGASDVTIPATAVVSDATVQPAVNGMAIATLSVPDLQDPPGTWAGATIHIASGQGWVFQTGTVTDSAPGSLTFSYVPLAPYDFQAPSAGDHFYLSGKAAALDAPGEWFRAADGTLSLIPPSGSAAGRLIEFKHRPYAFDLSGRSYIQVVGIHLFACTINTDAGSTNLLIDGIDARYVSHDLVRPDPWAIKLQPHTTGIILNGIGNVIQNSTIGYSSGDGIFLGGSDNTVENCVIHDVDYAGGDEAGVSTLGGSERVLNNTVYNCGRGGIVFRYSTAVAVLRNRVYNCGLQTTDVGALYTYQTDGQGSEIAWNLVSDTRTSGYGAAGIYLDNGSADYIVHHNVVWNCDAALKMNPPDQNIRIYNNTLVSDKNSVESSDSSDMAGSIFINNLFAGAANIGAAAQQSDNLFAVPLSDFANPGRHDYRLSRRSRAIDAGQVVAPFTDGYRGTAPDIGAYEYSVKPFAAGAARARRR
jgi:hypothetical protein